MHEWSIASRITGKYYLRFLGGISLDPKLPSIVLNRCFEKIFKSGFGEALRQVCSEMMIFNF